MNPIQSAAFANFAPGTVEAGEPIVSDPDDNGARTITYPFTVKPTDVSPSQVRASLLKLLGEGWRPCIVRRGVVMYEWDAAAIYRDETGREPPGE